MLTANHVRVLARAFARMRVHVLRLLHYLISRRRIDTKRQNKIKFERGVARENFIPTEIKKDRARAIAKRPINFAVIHSLSERALERRASGAKLWITVSAAQAIAMPRSCRSSYG